MIQDFGRDVGSFIGDIFFLKGISREVLLRGFKFIKNYQNLEIWLEEIEVLGAKDELYFLRLRMYNHFTKGIYIFILFIFILLIFFIFLCFYSIKIT